MMNNETSQAYRPQTIEALASAFATHGHGLTEAQLSQTRVALGNLHTAPDVFQPRDAQSDSYWTAHHVRNVAAAASRTKALDPILVFAIAGRRYIVDGHCRLEAYKLAGKRKQDKVPVTHLHGTFSDALLASAQANSKDKLPLTPAEKQEAAWRMVQHHQTHQCYSVRKIAGAASVSTGTVHNMTKRLGALLAAGKTLDDVKPWRLVRNSESPHEPMTDDALERERAEYVKRLHKAFGRLRSQGRACLLAEAIEVAYPAVYEAIRESLESEGKDGHAIDADWTGDDDSDF